MLYYIIFSYLFVIGMTCAKGNKMTNYDWGIIILSPITFPILLGAKFFLL
jgi:hypothetical protein